MELVEKYKWPVVAAVAVVVLGALLLLNSSTNPGETEDKKTADQTSEQKKAEETKKMESEKQAKAEAAKAGAVTYTARAGDSYTVLARKAVQAYAQTSGEKVSKAQIVAAETFLTQDAGSPLLNLGQNVELDKSVVAKAVAKAQALPASALAAWQTYVPYVNFDTSKNG